MLPIKQTSDQIVNLKNKISTWSFKKRIQIPTLFLAFFMLVLPYLGLKVGYADNPWILILTWFKMILIGVSFVMFYVKYRILFNEGLFIYQFGFQPLLDILYAFSLVDFIQYSFINSIKILYDSATIFIFLISGLFIFDTYSRFIHKTPRLTDQNISAGLILRAASYIFSLNFSIIFAFSMLEYSIHLLFGTNIFLYTVTQGTIPSQNNLFNYYYFNTVSFFGLGYGDLVPASIFTRIITILELMINFINTILIITFSLSKNVSNENKVKKISRSNQRTYWITYGLIILLLICYIAISPLRAPNGLREYSWISFSKITFQASAPRR